VVPCQSTKEKVATFRAAWLRVAESAVASIVAWNEAELEASLEVLARLFHAVERESIAEPLLAGLEQELDALKTPALRSNLIAIHDRSASPRSVILALCLLVRDFRHIPSPLWTPSVYGPTS